MTEEKSGKVGRAGEGGEEGWEGDSRERARLVSRGRPRCLAQRCRPGHRARGQGGWTKNAAPCVRAQVGTVGHRPVYRQGLRWARLGRS